MSEEVKKPEENLTKCKRCCQLKRRILAGKYDSGDKKWVDETGKQWMGLTCPYCNQKRSKNNMKKARDKKLEAQKNG